MAIKVCLEDVLKERGMTSKELCSLVNITEANLSVLRSGKAKGVRFHTINRICYFLQFYVSFFCFGFSADLSIMAALVMFVVGSIAVVVPTPNGAGPWHFAVITMMMLYGVGKEDAGIFALLVHGIQTFLLILLGIYGLAALPFTNKTKKL